MTLRPTVQARRRRARSWARVVASVAVVASAGALAIVPDPPAIAAGAPGTISTVAGQATQGDGGKAIDATLADPHRIELDAAGNVYLADPFLRRVRKVSTSGVITTVAGSGIDGSAGDGGPATNASLSCPTGVAADAAGSVYIADKCSHRIRKVSPSGVIHTIAGTGVPGYNGDGGQAAWAWLNDPEDVAVDASGNVYVADSGNGRVRRISTSGVITTVASSEAPIAVTTDATGSLFIAERAGRVRKVSTSGSITTVAGNGTSGFSGDGGPATSASLNEPHDVAVDADGHLYIADSWNNRVRRVLGQRVRDMHAGTISTFAGDGVEGFSGDGGPATAAQVWPYGLAVSDGDVYISDIRHGLVRKVEDVAAGSPLPLAP